METYGFLLLFKRFLRNIYTTQQIPFFSNNISQLLFLILQLLLSKTILMLLSMIKDV